MGKNTNLIAISGKKRSGKDTVADIIQDMLKEKYERTAFAAPLKQICEILTGIHVSGWQTEDDKDLELGPEWDTYDENGLEAPLTRRRFLTKLGTDAIGNNFNRNTFANVIFRDYEPKKKLIVTDLRFTNELKAVNKFDGITIRVSRPDKEDKRDAHASEVEMDGYTGWDFNIVNEGTLDELKDKVKYILFQLKLV